MGMLEDALRAYAEFEDRSTDPATPAAGSGLVYVKDGKIHSIDDTGAVTEYGPGGGGGVTFTPLNRVAVFNAATTATSIARTLSGVIAGVPADAVAVHVYGEIEHDVGAREDNWLGLFHSEAGTFDFALLQRCILASGVATAVNAVVGVVQDSGAKISYQINRGAGTITYSLFVTGYWAPA